tara:strand:+ start:606 stop:839 length:234 start_codon:yes stop_codon:yes gene_type:complete
LDENTTDLDGRNVFEGGKMHIGTLVRMIGDPHNVLGVVTEVIDDLAVNHRVYYKVAWLDDLCDPSYADEHNLEVICK